MDQIFRWEPKNDYCILEWNKKILQEKIPVFKHFFPHSFIFDIVFDDNDNDDGWNFKTNSNEYHTHTDMDRYRHTKNQFNIEWAIINKWK